ncbi:PPA1309 family protein [Ornithinicoccus hortensis]|uniref:Uncharacterized protein n=1 Tax=Ornithinicoccus hortensis TaxID=82346 RepID=A0A542YQ00_9MICO|nr:hypothetical protein FB467_1283 [Ornithinicoccus hortensis]
MATLNESPDNEPAGPRVPDPAGQTDTERFLLDAAADTERHVARLGWDQAPRMFALVRTADLLEREPTLRPQLEEGSPEGFTAIEQEGMLRTSNLESLLGRIAWPPEVDGVALAVERLVVPPEAERDLPTDPVAATEALAAHPDRQDVRLLAAVLRSGESVCLLRQRRHDEDDAVARGQDIAPGLVHALQATLQD